MSGFIQITDPDMESTHVFKHYLSKKFKVMTLGRRSTLSKLKNVQEEFKCTALGCSGET